MTLLPLEQQLCLVINVKTEKIKNLLSFFCNSEKMRIILISCIFLFVSNQLQSQNELSSIVSYDTTSLQDENLPVYNKARYLNFSFGWFYNTTHMVNSNNFFDPLSMVSSRFYPSFMYEFGINRTMFSEIGLDNNKQSISLSRTIIDDKSWAATTSYLKKQRNNNLVVGLGYRVMNKKNIFFNIHGGLYVGLSNKSISEMDDYIGGKATYAVFEEPINLYYTYVRQLTKYSRFTLGCYLGISKEIRLSKDILFCVKYSYRFGFIPQFSGTYDVYFDDNNLNFSSNFFSSGGGSTFTGGLKFMLN